MTLNAAVNILWHPDDKVVQIISSYLKEPVLNLSGSILWYWIKAKKKSTVQMRLCSKLKLELWIFNLKLTTTLFEWSPTSQAPTPPWKEPVHISFSRTRPLKYLLHSLLLRTGTWATLRTVSFPVPWKSLRRRNKWTDNVFREIGRWTDASDSGNSNTICCSLVWVSLSLRGNITLRTETSCFLKGSHSLLIITIYCVHTLYSGSMKGSV